MSLRGLLAHGQMKTTTASLATGADALRLATAKMSRQEFEQRGPALWMIHPIVIRPNVPVLYQTQPGAGSASCFPLDGFVCHPLKKTGANPWRERILIGRAPNNDVVLRDVWISKLHAWLEL